MKHHSFSCRSARILLAAGACAAACGLPSDSDLEVAFGGAGPACQVDRVVFDRVLVHSDLDWGAQRKGDFEIRVFLRSHDLDGCDGDRPLINHELAPLQFIRASSNTEVEIGQAYDVGLYTERSLALVVEYHERDGFFSGEDRGSNSEPLSAAISAGKSEIEVKSYQVRKTSGPDHVLTSWFTVAGECAASEVTE